MSTPKRLDSKSRGKVDWNKIRSTSRAEIEDAARTEFERLGIDASRLNFYRILNLATPDIKGIRRRLRLSQAQFAQRFGLNIRTLQEWEQGRSEPDQPARLLLSLIERSPAKISMLVNAVAAEATRRINKPSAEAPRP